MKKAEMIKQVFLLTTLIVLIVGFIPLMTFIHLKQEISSLKIEVQTLKIEQQGGSR